MVLNTWTYSAAIIERAITTIPIQPGPVLIDKVPDSYRGVYIFRKGLDQAIIRYGDHIGKDQKDICIQTVDWDQFIDIQNRFKTYSELDRSKYIAELRTLYRQKFPETPDSSISVYLFTSAGIVGLSNAKEYLED